MDTTPTRRKPATPPKPLTRFSNQIQDEKKVERKSLARYEDGGTKEGVVCMHDGSQDLVNTNKDGTTTKPTSANPLPPKPALLPKPQSPLKPCLRSRPQFPRHSSSGGLQPLITQDHPVVKPKNTELPPLMLRAPVAKLDEFDSLYGPPVLPVRPPRSPKIKAFPEGPFKILDEKPELPLKKRPTRTSAPEVKDWEHAKKRSSSLGRMGNVTFSEKRVQSLSLIRNVCPSDAFAAFDISSPSTGMKVGPVPPPRRHKKSEEALNICTDTVTWPVSAPSNAQIPVYAQVNYEMKKNRRELANLHIGSLQPEESVLENTMPILRGQLLITGNKIERNSFIKLIDPAETSVELLPVDNNPVKISVLQEDKESASPKQGNPEPITKCGLISEDNTEQQVVDALGVTEEITAHQYTEGITIQQRTKNLTAQQCTEDITAQQYTENLTAQQCIEDITAQRFTEDITAQRCTEDITAQRCTEDITAQRFTEDITAQQYTENITTQQCTKDNPDQISTMTMCEEIVQNVLPRHSALHCIMQGNKLQQSKSMLASNQTIKETFIASNDWEGVTTNTVPRKSELFRLVESPNACQRSTSSEVHPSTIGKNIVDSIDVETLVVPSVTSEIDEAEKPAKDIKKTVVRVQNETVDISATSIVGLPGDPYHVPISTHEVSKAPSLVVSEGMPEIKSENVVNFEVESLPLGAVLKNKRNELGQLWRRQSWSSSKDTTPSPDRDSVRKHKHSSAQGSWCDEGELSNGALADSDTGSSDNAGKKSLEDVATRSGPFVQSKKTSWFGSFGKGSKRKEKKIRASSQFYSGEAQMTPSSSAGSKSPQTPRSERNSGASEEFLRPNSVAGVVRSPSGVSSILDNMEEPPADADNFRDSESDNDEQLKEIPSPLLEEQRKERKVFLIAQELMTSERQFVGVLKLLNIDFVGAVDSSGTRDHPIIPHNELLKITNGLPNLQELNEHILQDLENRIQNWTSNPKIADIIVKKGPFLKLYSTYIRNFETQCNYLDECCQKYPQFGKVVKAFEASPVCKKLEVKHFMLKPVQRIPQYRLLLEDYQRNLDSDSKDFEDTEAALKIVRDVADHANKTIKLGDHLSKLIDLQSQLTDYEIIQPGRVYLKDGELFKLSRKDRHPRYFILLNDCLLYTTRLSTSFLRVNKELPLDGMKVSKPSVEDNLNEFNIISDTRSFTLVASSLSERQDWIDALENAIKDHACRKQTFSASKVDAPNTDASLKLGHQAPVWIHDKRVTMCQSCTTPFTYLFRRHHCRACGKVVCGHCSDNRAPLRYKGFQSERVCENCHDTLLQEFEGPESQSLLHDIVLERHFKNTEEAFEVTKNLFKKGSKKIFPLKNDIPQRLKEVAANDTGSQMSGWLQRRGRRSWKRLWFVLKDQVLYVYKASEDVVALESIPILGYTVQPMTGRHFQIYEGIDATLVFQLAHPGQLPLVFHADSQHLAYRWMTSMEEATVLH